MSKHPFAATVSYLMKVVDYRTDPDYSLIVQNHADRASVSIMIHGKLRHLHATAVADELGLDDTGVAGVWSGQVRGVHVMVSVTAERETAEAAGGDR